MASPSDNISLPAYPTEAYKSSRARIISEQPQRAPTMKIGADAKAQRSQGDQAMRLRGGCVPCPDGGCCYIIPLPCCC